MRLRRSSAAAPGNIRLRSKIGVMLVSLAALWAFAAWVTVEDGINLLQTGKRDTYAGRPTKTLLNILQDERRMTMVYMGGKRFGADPSALAAQRRRTDQAVDTWRRTTRRAPGSEIKEYIQVTSARLDGLGRVRAAVDRGTLSRDAAMRPFNDAIDSAFLIMDVNTRLDDQGVAADGRALVALTRARELLAREDAYLAGVLAQGRLGGPELTGFAQAAAVRGAAEADAAARLPHGDRARLDDLRRGGSYTGLQTLENRVLQQPHPNGRPGVTAAQWQSATRSVLTELDQTIDADGDELLKRATPVAQVVIAKLVGAGLIGLIAVLASIWLAVASYRQLLSQLYRLRDAAQDLADRRLPKVMALLGAGEKVDVAVEAPPLEFGDDEIGQVGLAFNQVQRAAIEAAAAQASLREANRRILLDLGLRSRGLLSRQLSLIDAMEKRRDIDVQGLKELFRLDQLTVRGQRLMNNLTFLAGGKNTVSAPHNQPLIDVLRVAVGQVEAYERVRILQIEDEYMAGFAFEDVVSLFAELIDNALNFSPHMVDIDTQVTATGIAVTIDDRGLGLEDEELQRINHFFETATEFRATEFDTQRGVRLGHFVVALRARNQDITVTLKRSPYGGVTAVVLLPRKLFVAKPEPITPPAPARPAAANVQPLPDLDAARMPADSNVAVLHRDRPAPVATLVAAPEPAPERTPDPEPAGPAEEPSDAEPEQTPNGLPVRRPQEHLVEALKSNDPNTEPDEDAADPRPEGRTPEEIRKVMSSYQRGTRQAREETAGKEAPSAAPHDSAGTEPEENGSA
ncbi:nitrate- and nitrite sensing domain-containing protein [Actinomadura terrae]|uniref:nitrate- and nitrite sensing domain-containing protein n=1 Tax=Actinomadura terrae TaxID=604353 RepID=UPI001FA73753|nr:nitrate- and nitrite sensing domain-containing protein [Actinomadura terrae]